MRELKIPSFPIVKTRLALPNSLVPFVYTLLSSLLDDAPPLKLDFYRYS